ncbi:hypothetical protein BaRGS_00017789, partial [Batillaria attramentaria]
MLTEGTTGQTSSRPIIGERRLPHSTGFTHKFTASILVQEGRRVCGKNGGYFARSKGGINNQ